ncbi:MAG: lipopolysaccharide heptosyltransferase II [Deltaproteobacteria bacterium]|nr:lipopolysaccharide heptosyltransferase II [Deltaproteobacteria bacterium]MBW2338977.1 lipopolysaccharide heptosyltransferase II [Deltaproteobacteria bacterium]
MRVRARHSISPENIDKILVRSTNWVGDTVMMLPSLAVVRRAFPHAQITVLANPWVVSLLKNHPAADRIMIIDKGKGLLSVCKELARIISELRREKFDLAVLFQNAFEAAFLASLGGVRYRLGYDTDGRGLLLTHKVKRDKAILLAHQVEYFLGIMEAMGWEVERREPRVYLDDKDVASANAVLATEGIDENYLVVGINPGAAYGSAKRWSAERFAVIGDWASQRWGAKVVLFGSFSERDVAAQVAQLMHTDPVNLCGKTTLGEGMALIKRCNFFVTNDSGLMHIAAAFDTPLVAVFGPTDHMRTSPVSRNARIVRHSVECSPCLKEVCPSDHRCMLSIEPEEVWDQMEALKKELKIVTV